MIIEIVTLLLGIITGPTLVEVAVAPEVAAVEIHLDGERVALRDAPPWRLVVDFGPAPLPHRLEAVAFDAAGRELARSGQFVNFRRGNQDVAIVLDSVGDGAAAGRVVWESMPPRRLRELELELDGERVEVARDGSFRVAVAGEGVHALTARVRLAGLGDPLVAELAFGAGLGYSDRMTSALTPVAVRVAEPRAELPSPEAMRGWLEADGHRLGVWRVQAAEAAKGLIVVVRDAEHRETLRTVERQLRRDRTLDLPRIPGPPTALFVRTQAEEGLPLHQVVQLPDSALGRVPGRAPARDRFGAPPSARHMPDREETRLDLWEHLAARVQISDPKRPQSVADAAALGAFRATLSEQPRAVLVVLGEGTGDHSRFSLAAAARYGAAVGVPVLVWAPDAATATRWRATDDGRLYLGAPGLVAAFEEIADQLARQRVLWVEGAFLPHEIGVGSAAPPGFELAR